MRWLPVFLIILAACTAPIQIGEQPVDETPEILPEEPVVVDPPLMYNTLFSYDELSAFTYHAAVAGTTVLVTTEITPGMHGGVPVYVLTAFITESDREVVMFIDKESHACTHTYMRILDDKIDDLCPVEGLNSRFADDLILVELREEELRVLAGSYNTTVLTTDGVTYWVAEDAPLPVKYAGEGYEMQLVGYE